MNAGMVGFEEARSIAEDQATSDVGRFVLANDSLLDEVYLEAPGCWLFFLNGRLKLPEGASLGINWAYAVSKNGRVSMVEDFPGDEERRLELVKKMSDFFERVER